MGATRAELSSWLGPSPESLQAGLDAAPKPDGSIQNSHESTDDKFRVLLRAMRLERTSKGDYVFSMTARSPQAEGGRLSLREAFITPWPALGKILSWRRCRSPDFPKP